jgi:uncharacterized protein YndB with AHSA1/START domain
MRHLIFIALLLLAHGCTGSPVAGQSNLPSAIREMARKVMMPVVLQDDDDRSREIIRGAIEFMKSNLSMKENNRTNVTREMALTRVFDAPVSEVWKYWIDPEKVKKWWGPKGFTSPVANMDVREGSTSFACMRPPPENGGQDMCNTWAYKKIVPEKEIEFVMAFANKDGKKLDPATLGLPAGMPQEVRHVITFRAIGGKTEVTFKEFRYTAEQVLASPDAPMTL